ncbi:hypothetical protein JGU66_07615 [Myxococcaceae bacterium JPH2]|nr:hypothetical protein [Myxococcaceae bacterium JPH2]
MQQPWKAALTAAAVVVGGGAAQAHDFVVLKLVNGHQTIDITSYPTTIDFTTVALNSHPTLPSELLTATDPLMEPFGWTFTPTLPQSVPVGGNLISYYKYVINSVDDCIALGNADDDPTTPGSPDSSFTNTFAVTWDSGTAQSSVKVTCKASNALPCDNTLYFSMSGLGLPNTSLNKMDTTTAALTPFSTASSFYSAAAFNHLDGYVYAIDNTLPLKNLIKIGADGVASAVAPLPELGLNTFPAGTVLADGTYLVYSGPGFGILPEYARINLTTNTVTFSGPTLTIAEVLDFATNPLDSKVYGYNHVTHRLTTFDPATGDTTDFGPVGPNDALTGLPALYFVAPAAAFDTAGNFYIYGSDLTGLLHPVNTLYKVDIATGAFTVVAVGDVSLNGNENFAMCAFAPAVGGGQPSITRNEGYFKTHEQAVAACLAKGGDIDLGKLGVIGTKEEALGVLWMSSATTADRRQRTDEDAMRVKLGRQTLTATCNARLFGSPAQQSIDGARSAMDSGTPAEMETRLKELRVLNDQGSKLSLPSAFNGGPAGARHALSIASAPRGSSR